MADERNKSVPDSERIGRTADESVSNSADEFDEDDELEDDEDDDDAEVED